ncbi:hypothetical protein [Planctomicrobium sp. SH527]|uniref:hypothetical protein n=1 Tax=Planctomicrobium sp. SH527 TaxID=3448123 RepID=UPI003F5AEA7B
MSGKPSSAAVKKPATPATPTKPVAKPGAGAPQKSSSPSVPTGARPAAPGAGRPGAKPAAGPGSKDKADSDDPFDVDTSAMRRAIKLAPKPVKGRTLEVVCPMCETPGYMLPTDAGKDVQCCNPSCMVPVFKTRKPKVEEAPKVESKGNKTLLLAGVGAAVLIGGVAVWLVTSGGEDPSLVVKPMTPAVDEKDKADLVPSNQIKVQTEKPLLTLAEVQKQSLVSIVDRARQRDKNRQIEYGVQQAAISFAIAGDLKRAQEQIKRLQQSNQGIAYLQIQPLTEVGWLQLRTGKKAEAAATAKEALAFTKNLPKSVRRSHDYALALASLLVATDQTENANNLIEQQQDATIRGTLSLFWRMAVYGLTFDVDLESRFPWHVGVAEPMRMGVVEELVVRKLSDQALAFAGATKDSASQAACRAAWAGRLVLTQSAAAIPKVTAAIEAGKFDAATQVQVWAAVADAAHVLKDSATATASLEKAVAAMATVEAPTTVNTPGRKEIYDSDGKPNQGLPDSAPSRSAAQAASSLAIVQLHLGQNDAALAMIQKGLDFYRGMTPGPVVTRNLVDECQKQESLVRADLAKVLGIPNSDDRVRIAFNRYRQQCGRLNDLAVKRLDLQVTLLRYFAEAGLLEQVWAIAQERGSVSDVALQEPYLTTQLPGLLLALSEATGQSTLSANLKAAFPEKGLVPENVDLIYATTAAQISAGQLVQASNILERAFRSNVSKRFPDHLDAIALRMGGRVQAAHSTKDSIAFIQRLFDQLIQEDLFLLLAGDAANRDKAGELWRLTLDSRELDALEFVALYRGFVGGGVTPPAQTTAVETTTK